MSFTPEEEAELRILLGITNKTVSDLELAPTLAGDMLMEVESGSGTFSVAIDNLKNFILANTPAFKAVKRTNQTVTIGVLTKITFATEVLDNKNYFDNAINHRFQPLISGWYLIQAGVKFVDLLISQQGGFLFIYKNGASFQQSSLPFFDNGDGCISISSMIYFNGSTDYVEIFGLSGGSSANTIGGSASDDSTYFSGFKLNV